MAFLPIIRSGIALADKMTKDLQPKVKLEKFIGVTGSGKRTYSAAVMVPAIVDWKQKHVMTASGQLAVSRASVMFLDPTILVDDDDRITLPDGTTGPIIDMAGFIDAETGHPVSTEVFLG